LGEAKAAKLALFNESALRHSLYSGSEELKLRLQVQAEETARATNFRLMTLAVLAPVLALIGVAIQPNVGKPDQYPTLDAVAQFTSLHFAEMLALCLVILLFSWGFTGASTFFAKNGSSRDLLRLGLIDERRSAAISLSVALIFLSIAGYFGSPILRPLFETASSWF
jgi:hypothetical protein